MTTQLYFLTALALVTGFLGWKRLRDRRVPLPPGPKKLPLLGNILDIPKEKNWITYHQWSKDLSTYPCVVSGTSDLSIRL
jgi:hypothetical protein